MKRPLSFLIVDDEPAHRLLTSRALRKHFSDSTLIEADSCKNAIILLDSTPQKPDIVLLDLNLGTERGTTLLRLIRERSWGVDLPIIILSTSSLDLDIIESYDARVSAFITKSSATEEYQENIKNAVLFFLRPL